MAGSYINRIFLIIAICLSLFFSGCISFTTTHKQFSDGSSKVVQDMDMSSLFSLTESYSSSTNSVSLLSETCYNVSKSNPDIKCNYSNSGVITLTKTFKPKEAFYTFETKDDFLVKKYRLTIDQLPDLGEDTSNVDSSTSQYLSQYTSNGKVTLNGSGSKMTASVLKVAGVEYEYRVSMPGDITKAKNAKKFDKSIAVFDVIELMEDGKPIVVESEEINWLVVAFLAFMGFVLLAAIALIIVLGLRR